MRRTAPLSRPYATLAQARTLPSAPLKPLFAASMFCASGLLFLIEPIVAKALLPYYGGSPLVWSISLLFFQSALLGGYFYAHRFATAAGRRRLHIALLALASLWLLVTFGAWQTPSGWYLNPHWPAFGLSALLILRIGLPFLILAAGAPLLQSWYASTSQPDSHDPYFLYAASNLGSLLGLLSYPVLIEPVLTLSQQRWLCAALLIAVTGLFAWCALAASAQPKTESDQTIRAAQDDSDVPTWTKLRWLLLAAAPSAMLIGLTAYLSVNLAPIPLLWIIPLSLYLITFIIVFSRRTLFSLSRGGWAVAILGAPVAFALASGHQEPLAWFIPIHLVGFFALALACHSEVYRLRPHAKHLTSFYLWIAGGGALGGLFAALVAPVIFSNLYEYPIAFVCAWLALGGSFKTGEIRWPKVPIDLAIAALAGWAVYHWYQTGSDWLAYPAYACIGGAFLLISLTRPIRYGLVVAAALGVITFANREDSSILLRERNYFGVHTVQLLAGNVHELLNGTIVHGREDYSPGGHDVPSTYYTRSGPVGVAIAAIRKMHPIQNFAIVGLGTGTMSTYGLPGEQFDFYDIDPEVPKIATNDRYFTFLTDCPAQWRVILGDARLELAKAPQGRYDFMVLDAFSSDAIPIHLITRQAMSMYLQKLSRHGVLAVHISNRYLDLKPVLKEAAAKFGKEARIVDDDSNDEKGTYGTTWVLFADSAAAFEPPPLAGAVEALTAERSIRLWTDDYSDLYAILK